MRELMSVRGAPVFFSFFLWSLGTGSIQLARPLFAASFDVSLALVALVTSSNSIAHLISGPLTGLMVDRWGRKPLLLIGLTLRGASLFAEYFANSYLDYLLMEFVGGLGVAIWLTGSTVLLADLSIGENRARAVALRTMTSRLGFIAGPLIGAVVATVWDLRSVFLFNAFTKVVLLVIVGWFVAESRPGLEARATDSKWSAAPAGLPWGLFRTRAFAIIAVTTFSISLMHQGVFSSLFPVYLKSLGPFGTADVGTLMTIGATVSFAITFPNGMLADRYGRKKTLVPGLVILAAAATLFLAIHDFTSGALVVALYGAGEGVCLGVSQVYAMDLAPRDRRGAFLGVWTLITQSGSALAPLLVGIVAERMGFGTVFLAVGILLTLTSTLMAVAGPDTRGSRSTAPAAS